MPHFRIRPLAAFAFVIALSARPAAVLAGNNSQVPLPVAPVFSLLEACPTESPSLGSRQAPGDAAYADFVRATSHTFGGRLDPDLRARLDKMLSSSERPGLANEIGVMLAAQRSIFAAVYVLAKGAQGSPRDAVLANDLGVALKGLGDYGEAAQALLYAGRIAPDRPVILTNLGFLAIAMRDGSYAQSALNRAIKADPSEPHALAGLAMLAECRKDHAEAAKMFRESLRVEFFPMAAVGMQAALSSMTSEEIDQDGQEAGALSRPASPAAGRVLNVPPPPIGPAWADVGPSYDRVKDYDADNQRRIHQLAFQFQEERQRAAHEAGESFSSGVMLLSDGPTSSCSRSATWRAPAPSASRTCRRSTIAKRRASSPRPARGPPAFASNGAWSSNARNKSWSSVIARALDAAATMNAGPPWAENMLRELPMRAHRSANRRLRQAPPHTPACTPHGRTTGRTARRRSRHTTPAVSRT